MKRTKEETADIIMRAIALAIYKTDMPSMVKFMLVLLVSKAIYVDIASRSGAGRVAMWMGVTPRTVKRTLDRIEEELAREYS